MNTTFSINRGRAGFYITTILKCSRCPLSSSLGVGIGGKRLALPSMTRTKATNLLAFQSKKGQVIFSP
jgi:hypothetical protein